jgi:uncharacterized hydrophobic protein (TIGR00271 family)
VSERLREADGVAHVARLPGAALAPPGDVILCDVVREAANSVIEWLQDEEVHHHGAICVEGVDAVVSDAAAAAEAQAAGLAADALVWEEIEARARDDAQLSVSFVLFMGLAAVIAGIGILLDSPILIVAAMVVGPEYGPLSALCVAAARRRGRPALRAAGTLAAGFGAAAIAALLATAALRAAGLAPDNYEISERQLTAFISRPDALAVVVAVVAGIVGMLSVTEARSGSLIGVLVSVTTIPAVANVGVATAYGQATEVRGAALQLAVNIAGLVGAGIVTLVVQSRATADLSRAAP